MFILFSFVVLKCIRFKTTSLNIRSAFKRISTGMLTNCTVAVFNQIGGILQSIDERLKMKIKEFVAFGVTDVSEMQRHLSFYVGKELFPGKLKPAKTNRRFYPHQGDVRNHMYLATAELRHSKIDQIDLEEKNKTVERGTSRRLFLLQATWRGRIVRARNKSAV